MGGMGKKKVKKKNGKAKEGVKDAPLTNGRNGKGQFVNGNGAGKGHKASAAYEKAKQLKRVFAAAITDDAVKKIALSLVKSAKKGDVQAAKEIFDRLWGKAPQAIELGDGVGGPLVLQCLVTKTYKSDDEKEDADNEFPVGTARGVFHRRLPLLSGWAKWFFH